MTNIGNVYRYINDKNELKLYELICKDILNDRRWIVLRPLTPNTKFIMSNVDPSIDIDYVLSSNGFILNDNDNVCIGGIDDNKLIISSHEDKLYAIDLFSDIKDEYEIIEIYDPEYYEYTKKEEYTKFNMDNLKLSIMECIRSEISKAIKIIIITLTMIFIITHISTIIIF